MTGRDPSPAASFNEPPTFVSGAFWAMRGVPLPGGGLRGVVRRDRRSSPDLFARLRMRRIVTRRLVAAGVAAVLGAALLVVVPALGLAIVVFACWSASIDALLLSRLRRSIAEAWIDLTLPEE